MALKPDRRVIQDNVFFFMNHVAERGGIVVAKTFGSGIATDQSSAVVEYSSSTSGAQPIGLLLNEVVDVDLTRQMQNFHKDEVQKGSKVTLLQIGEVVTNLLHSGITVAAGEKAYLHDEGRITNSQTDLGANLSPQVGLFLSKKDEDGYARVYINIR